MADPLQPESSPSVDTPHIVDTDAVSANTASSASEQGTQSPWGEIPEQILEDWRWIFNGREEGVFDGYAGKHVAAYQQKIWGSSYDPDLLREYVALKYQIDPKQLVVVYFGRW